MEFAEQPSPARTALEHAGWRLEYAAVDAGPSDGPRDRAVIAFHGFARPLEDLLIWQSHWPAPVRLIAVHLPHHGASGPVDPGLPSDAALPPASLLDLVQRIAEREGCAPSDMDLIGYSIGGRIALTLLVEAPEVWDRVVLLAPDGLRKAPLYDLTVHTLLGRWMWRGLDRYAPAVNAALGRLHRWGVVPRHLLQFALFHTETAEMRDMVWHGWRAHRLCWPPKSQVVAALEGGQMGRVDFCFGTKDRVIPASNADGLRKRLKAPAVRFHRVHSGHGMLREDVLREVLRVIFEA